MLRPQSDELWAVNAHLDLVLNSVTDHAIFTLGIDGRITSWNRGARRTKGYDQSEIVGQHFSVFYTKADQDNDVPMRSLRISNDLGKHETEGWRIRKGGELFWASVVIHPVRDVQGELRGFVKVVRGREPAPATGKTAGGAVAIPETRSRWPAHRRRRA